MMRRLHSRGLRQGGGGGEGHADRTWCRSRLIVWSKERQVRLRVPSKSLRVCQGSTNTLMLPHLHSLRLNRDVLKMSVDFCFFTCLFSIFAVDEEEKQMQEAGGWGKKKED
ncbi:hypothetical protein E2C01_100846 [Portunus trituberculatus]|uniref:Uncharacterized protein n=1 Tax=Portunus trituberculatus TaxID=210409 RepID=A0A5B7KIJ7_PORTR|nr:hypothetical protein [Portunus trituberculatus]